MAQDYYKTDTYKSNKEENINQKMILLDTLGLKDLVVVVDVMTA